MSENTNIADAYLFLIGHIYDNDELPKLIERIDINLTRAFKEFGVSIQIKQENRGMILVTATNGVVSQNYENSIEFFSSFTGNEKFIEDFSKEFFCSFFDTYFKYKNNLTSY